MLPYENEILQNLREYKEDKIDKATYEIKYNEIISKIQQDALNGLLYPENEGYDKFRKVFLDAGKTDRDKEEVKKLLNYQIKVAEKIKKSQVFCGLVTKNFLKDPYCAIQLGIGIMLDKPIYIIADKGTIIPDNLKKVAKKIYVADTLKDYAKYSKEIIDEYIDKGKK